MSLQRYLIILVLLVLGGCSRTALLYDNADLLLQRWAGGLLDANASQRAAWRALLHASMDEHQRDLLPELIGLLHTLEVGVDRGLVAAEIDCWAEAVDRVYRRHAAWAVRPAALLLLDASPDQIEHLAAQLAERNRAYREAYLDPDPVRRRRARIARYTDRIEQWTGDLSTEQLRLVEYAVQIMPDVSEDWLDYRQSQQRRMLALLRGRAGSAALQRFLADWWIEFADRSPALLAGAGMTRSATIELILALDATLSAAQRANIVRQLADLQEGFERVLDPASPAANVGRADLACQHTKQQRD